MAGPSNGEGDREYRCIIKVTDGRDFKMSAHVRASLLHVAFNLTCIGLDRLLGASYIPRCIRGFAQKLNDDSEKA
jgi:hypothetical protein